MFKRSVAVVRLTLEALRRAAQRRQAVEFEEQARKVDEGLATVKPITSITSDLVRVLVLLLVELIDLGHCRIKHYHSCTPHEISQALPTLPRR